MEKPKPEHHIILHPDWKCELPDSFHFLVRNDRFLDCVSCKIGNVYIEAEVVEQENQMGIVRISIPHRLISLILLEPQKIAGFAQSIDDMSKVAR